MYYNPQNLKDIWLFRHFKATLYIIFIPIHKTYVCASHVVILLSTIKCSFLKLVNYQ